MATIYKEITVKPTVDRVWEVLRDVGALHTRLVPGFVVDTQLEPGARVVTFANGRVVRERIVSVDDEHRRIVWSAVTDKLEHHNGAAQALRSSDGSTRVVWIADVLPEEVAGTIEEMMDAGMRAMQGALDALG